MLKITSVTRENGAACNHVTLVVDHEGVSRTFKSSFPELDALVASLGGPAEAAKTLVLLWAGYRRTQGRTTVNIEIA
jgi:hypothetical protein